MQNLIDVLRANGIAIVPDFSQAKQRNGSQWLFTGSFTIGEKSVRWGYFGDFKTKAEGHWLSDNLSPEEVVEATRQLIQVKEKYQKERVEGYKHAADEAKRMLQQAADRGTTPYMHRKGIRHLSGARILCEQDKLILLVPIQDIDGEIWSVQKIYPEKFGDGIDKIMLKGGKKQGCFFPFNPTGEFNPQGEIYVCEGWSTGASVFEALGKSATVITAIDAGNIAHVGAALRERYPSNGIVFCADNDQFDKRGPSFNAGIAAAQAGINRINDGRSGSGDAHVRIAYPTFKSLEGKPTDFNDLHQREGLAEVTRQLSESKELPKIAASIVEEPKKTVIKKPNEILLAQELYKQYAARIIKQDRDFFLYTGTHWRFGDESVRGAIRNEIRKLSNLMYNSREVNSAFATFFDLIPSVPQGFNMFAGNPMAANFKNGTLHLRRAPDHSYMTEFTKHQATDFITSVLPFDYLPESKEENPAFIEMLRRIWKDEPDQEEKIRLYGQVMGACLLGAFPMIVLFIGTPGSGKSTLLKLAARLVDQENLCFVDPVHFEGFNMETMVNKLVNVVTDLNTRRPIADEVVKQIVDRHQIRFRRKGIKDVQGYLPPIHLWAANEFPKSLEGAVGSYERRAIILRTEKFQVKSLDTYHKDFPEWVWDQSPQGIINFAVRGAMDLIGRRGHYSVPESSRGEMQKWSHESDAIGVFLQEVIRGDLVVDSTQVILKNEGQFNGPRLWELFKVWHRQDLSYDTRVKKNQFYDRLRKEGFVEGRNASQRYWSGMELIASRGATN